MNRGDLLTERELRWQKFHRWEEKENRAPLDLQSRLAWYQSAIDLAAQWGNAGLALEGTDLEAKVQRIERIRSALAHLSTHRRNVRP